VIDPNSGAVTARISDLVPYELWRDAGAVWAIARPADAATDAKENDMDLVRIDPVTLAMTRHRLPRELADFSFEATAHAGDLFFAGPGAILQVSRTSATIVRRIPLDDADQGALLVSTGSELWAIPIESTPVTNGFDNRSRQLVQIDPKTGSFVRRFAIRERGVGKLGYAYGSLWILAPDADYSGSFGMHLVRIELPAEA
jgi:hypothetical protein